MSLDHSSGARRTLSTVPTLALTPLLTRTLTLMLVLAGCNLSALDNPYAGRAVTTPVAVSGSRSYSRIAAGFFHSCALTTGGRAYCWGSNEYQQLGTDAPVPQCEQRRCTHAPVAAGAGGTYSEIATGTTTTCAITTSKRAVCWGGSYPLTPPALGDGTTSESATPVFVQTDSLLSAITVGGNHACALTASGAALCWGSNQSGQLGDSSATARGIPVLVLGTLRFRSIAAGGGFTCGITFDGDAYCWGSNRWGQLGIGEVPYNAFGVASIRPRRVESSLKWLAIGVGAEHTCAIAAGGLAYCWGRNENAQQLGDGSHVTHRGVPGPVSGGRQYDAIGVGSNTACGHTAANELYCWGSNYFGALGNGRTDAGGVDAPVRTLGGPYGLASVGGSHSCALRTDASARCWGDGFFGQLGER